MGHWGVAMSYLQPLWSYPTDQEMRAGAAALQRARATLHDPKVTELEKGHVWVRTSCLCCARSVSLRWRVVCRVI